MHTGNTSVPRFASRTRSGTGDTFVRVALAAAIACAPVTAALAQGTQTVRNNQQGQTNGQRQPTPGRLTVPITGTLGTAATPTPGAVAAAASTVTGSFSIQRFARTTEDGVAAVGTLVLSFVDPASNAARTIVTQVAMSVAKSGGTTPPGGAADQAQPIVGATLQASAPAAAEACGTLSLVLEPPNLDQPGLAVQLDQVNVNVTAVQGTAEQMRNLLCEVAGLVEGTAPPAELVNKLNTLLDVIG